MLAVTWSDLEVAHEILLEKVHLSLTLLSHMFHCNRNYLHQLTTPIIIIRHSCHGIHGTVITGD